MEKKELHYNGFIYKVAKQFEEAFQKIAVRYNFDNGDEFEIALCKAIRPILPSRFGICRGYVVTKDNQFAGDDIVIYDRDKFPTLRFLDQQEYGQKEDIPVEAVCAYIEAKHSIILSGKGPQSIWKAMQQVMAVKSLQRKKLEVGTLPLGMNYMAFGPFPDDNWPPYSNPIFAAIFARQTRLKEKGASVSDAKVVYDNGGHSIVNGELNPDLIVFGDSVVALPLISEPKLGADVYCSPFFIKDKSRLIVTPVDGIGFAIGIINILQALNFIQLDRINWQQVVGQALQMKKYDEEIKKLDNADLSK